MHYQFNEGLESGDLTRLLHTEIHIDEFRSKLGRDEDVIVVSFKVTGKAPATDLMNFCERGYTWVLDADLSAGEMDDGDYVVFVESERNAEFPKNFMRMLQDVGRLNDQSSTKWRFRYHTSTQDHAVTVENLTEIVPLSTSAYEKKFGSKELDRMRAAAGLEIKSKAPVNPHTESIKRAAGII